MCVQNKLPKRTNLCSAIAKGNKFCDLVTTNMEAFMRTVLFVGCGRDWPGYLNSKIYTDWFNRMYNVKANGNGNVENENGSEGGDENENKSSGDGNGDPPTAMAQPDTTSRPVSVCICLFVPVGFHELN